MISPDYVLCYLPRVLEICWEKMIFFNNFGFFLSKLSEKNWKLHTSYNFQSRMQIMTPGGVYCITKMLPHFDFILWLGKSHVCQSRKGTRKIWVIPVIRGWNGTAERYIWYKPRHSSRVTKSENFPDSKIFVAKTFQIKRVNCINFKIRDKGA